MKKFILTLSIVLGFSAFGYCGDGFFVIPVKTKVKNADTTCVDNSNRYVICGNGTVTDTISGLIWLKDANCFGSNDFTDAHNAAANLKHGDCGLSDNSIAGDWRLPTKEEWEASIVYAVTKSCTNPAIMNVNNTDCWDPTNIYVIQHFFNVGFLFYWSSTTSGSDSSKAWITSMSDGSAGWISKATNALVWPVRSDN